ncbi:hypothetical protein SAMN04488511_1082 [Pedobacter suwonensis]|uniref:Uncharacterized protein n=1 Tax=Pedobacter suwonensis TaxID=332999 RepID=A0A1I0TBH9_9SPHI|nr:DUF4175 family protein [Pedobacter suwonensis]SFA49154.1 hypothetical protein SAMN04488511_1082 [Pedobacter suwonensis]
MVSNNYNDLLRKIDEFIRKFYLNKILRGSIYAAAILLALYLIVFLSLYYLNPTAGFKTFVFFAYLLTGVLLVGFLIVKPLLAMLKLGKHLTLDEASVIIGNHFSDIKDKLLNTLQLHHLAEKNPENNRLIMASIDQKIIELRPVPFYTAVKINDNRKYLKYLFVPLSIILLIAIIAPTILRDGTNSFFRYDEYIAPKAPFSFTILNKSLTPTQGDDLTLNLKLTGDELPAEIYVEDGKNTYKLEKESINKFNYSIKNIQNDKKLIFKGGGFSSAVFTVTVKPRPELLNATATLNYPAYLGKNTESVDNVGDLLLPEGTKVTWSLKTEKSDQVLFMLNGAENLLKINNDVAHFRATIKNNSRYNIIPKNQYVTIRDSLSHQITVFKDQAPQINVEEKQDSLSNKVLYFSGQVTDDYGFSRLSFKYNLRENNRIVGTVTKNIAIKSNATSNIFFYFWDLKVVAAKPGQEIEYYFEVADNDGVNGAKVTRSEIKTFKQPTKKESAEQVNASNQALKQKVQSAIRLANTIEKESKKVAESLIDKKQISFEDKKQIEALLDKQKQLDEAMKEIKAQNDKNIQQQQDQKQTEELIEKQKQIKDLFDHVLDDKTKELLQKLQALMNEKNKDQTQNELSKMQLDNKTLKNELDRILELYKQLEFEQNLQNDIDRLNELAKQQKELSQQTKDKKQDYESLKQKQDALNKEMKDLKDDLKKLEEKNKSLDRPNPFENPEKEIQDIQKDQQDSKDALDKKDAKSGSQKQQKAGEQMEKLSKKMSEMQQQGEEMENNLNAKELRRLLENLLTTSFDQEKVMLALKKMSATDPSYTSNVQKQRSIKDNLKTISDSLYSLSKRVPQIESTVNEEMNKINFNLDKSLENLGDRRTAEANRFQQFTMTSINNLTLMLSEALSQLQNMQKNSKGGSGKKQKQGMKQLSQMQEQLNKSMQKAREQLQKQGGNQGTVGKGQMSQEFGKMAQQQQMIRQALEKLNREENKDGTGKLGNLNEAIKEMKQTESDLVNKRLQQETLNRQKDLLTKLLEAEKAERDQEEDSKRESKAAKEFPPSYQKMLDQFKKQQQNGSDILQKIPPGLNYYYKNKIAEYLKSLNVER